MGQPTTKRTNDKFDTIEELERQQTKEIRDISTQILTLTTETEISSSIASSAASSTDVGNHHPASNDPQSLRVTSNNHPHLSPKESALSKSGSDSLKHKKQADSCKSTAKPSKCIRHETVGARAVSGPGLTEQEPRHPPQESTQIVTLMATPVENEEDMEERVRQQILRQAVQAQVLSHKPHDNDSENDTNNLDQEVPSLDPPKTLPPNRRWVTLLVLVVFLAAVAGGVTGAVVATRHKQNQQQQQEEDERKRSRIPPVLQDVIQDAIRDRQHDNNNHENNVIFSTSSSTSSSNPDATGIRPRGGRRNLNQLRNNGGSRSRGSFRGAQRQYLRHS